MSKWDIGDAYEAIFGDHYGSYKFFMGEIEKLNELRERVYHDFMIDNYGTLGRELADLLQSYQHLCDNLDTKNYGWNGKDMRACWQRSLELRDEVRELKRMRRAAGESIMAGIDAKRDKFCAAAMREINSFSVMDKITGTVDYAAQEVKNQLAALVNSL